MAVTQQLVRIEATDVAYCQRDEKALCQLLAFRLPPTAALLDLDWAPQGLIEAARGIGRPELAADLDCLMSGDGSRVVSEEWPEGPPSDPVYSRVTYLTKDEVTSLWATLSEIDPAELAQAAARALQGGEQPDDPLDYYSGHFLTLRTFLGAASQEHQVVVSWWD